MFNSIKYNKELEEAGFTHEQAKVTIGVFYKFMEYSFATKEDFQNEAVLSKSRFAAIEKEFALIRTEIRNDFQNFEHRMIIKLGLMQVASIALLVTLLKF